MVVLASGHTPRALKPSVPRGFEPRPRPPPLGFAFARAGLRTLAKEPSPCTKAHTSSRTAPAEFRLAGR